MKRDSTCASHIDTTDEKRFHLLPEMIMQWKQVSCRFGQSIVNLYKSNRQLGFSNYPLLTKTTKIAAIANAMKDAPTATSMLDPAVPVLFVLVEL